ncbi:MAG: HEAT repeat domain-containing protein [Clostridiaceae bacterium]
MESKNLLNYNWNSIDQYSDEEITYFLYLESIPKAAIARIRGINISEVERHIISGKIKYRYLAKAKNCKELLEMLTSGGKDDKLALLESLTDEVKDSLINYIKENYINIMAKDKETAIWIIGELKREECIDILTKAIVHKFINVRRMAVSALGKIGSKKGEILLLRALEDENPQVVSYAIKSLKKINSEVARDKIKKIYSTTSNNSIKNACEKFLNNEV